LIKKSSFKIIVTQLFIEFNLVNDCTEWILAGTFLVREILFDEVIGKIRN